MITPLGKISKQQDGFQVRFERELNHPIRKVWEAITDPGQLRYWFTDIEMDFRPGGKITFQFRDEAKSKSYGEIISIDPPGKFVWTWEGELAVWELTELSKDKTQLVFTYSKLSGDYAIKAPAGFHLLLDRLQEVLEGSTHMYKFGAEEGDPESKRLQVRYAASVFNEYPEVVESKPVVVEHVYNASIEKVWKAISDRDQMKQWYFDLDKFEPKVGFTFQFPGQGHKGEKYLHICTITEVIPFRKLQYSWAYDKHPGYSIVTFELIPEGERVKVRLTHHGIDSFPDHPDFAATSFTQGWTELIHKYLKEFAEKQ